MLALPQEGMNYSAAKHNSRLDIFCDWIEANVLFSDDSLSKSDIADCLIESQIYTDQAFAMEFVETAWGVIRQRVRHHGAALGISQTALSLQRIRDWKDFPAYGYCMLLSCLTYLYPNHAATLNRNIGTQGELFERLSQHSLIARFPNWTVRRVGWSPNNPVRLNQCIDQIIGDLCEREGAEKDLYVDNYANEIGLDLLLYSKFIDERPCFPVFMVQCASGKDWKNKRKTPDLSIWRQIISFNSAPIKGFMMPYAFVDDQDFRKLSITVEGMFFDRYRVLFPRGVDSTWIPAELNADLILWSEPMINTLPVIATVA